MKLSILFSLVLAAGGCGGGNSPVSNSESAPAVEMQKMAMADGEQTAPTGNIPMERKLIKTGQLTFESSDLTKTRQSVEQLCKNYKAYISSENLTAYGDRKQHTLEILVPSESYDSLTNAIEGLAVKVENKSTNVQDVTEEFIDVEARLKTKRELEARYLDLLKQAKKIEEIVAIESQLANVRSEIESMEGRLKYLSSQVAYSTLSLNYYEIISTDYGFATKFIRSLSQGWNNLLDFIIVLINLWPFVFLLAGGIWIVKRFKRKPKVDG